MLADPGVLFPSERPVEMPVRVRPAAQCLLCECHLGERASRTVELERASKRVERRPIVAGFPSLEPALEELCGRARGAACGLGPYLRLRERVRRRALSARDA